MSTVDEYIQKLDKIADQAVISAALTKAVSSIHARISKRIFTDGKKTDGSNIGQYDTKNEIYVNPKTAVRLKGVNPPQGKHGDQAFGNGKPHKTRYFPNYKEFRQAVDRRTDKVNINLTGDLKSDFDSGLIKVSDLEYHIVLKRDINSDKAHGNEDHFGGLIFKMSKAEKDSVNKIFGQELKVLFNK